jgi:hypothetical protein
MKEKNPAQVKLQELFDLLADEAEATDFDCESIEQSTEIDWLQPWVIPIDILRDYFGEKIGLYFSFLQYAL